MVHKRLLCPERLRRVPSQFSWVDHRLVREGYLEHCSAEACALYLLLVTVGDAQGLSYYSDASLSRRLHIDPQQLERARGGLIAADLVAFEPPLYQVLSLPGAAKRETAKSPFHGHPTRQRSWSPPETAMKAKRRTGAPKRLSEILRELAERR